MENPKTTMLKIIDQTTPFNVDFYANSTRMDFGQEVTFSDITITNSGDAITGYQWTFEGGQPASSTERNPAGITFTKPGSHDVSLQVTTTNGMTQRITKTDYITSTLNYCFSKPYYGTLFNVNSVILGTINHRPAKDRSTSYL